MQPAEEDGAIVPGHGTEEAKRSVAVFLGEEDVWKARVVVLRFVTEVEAAISNGNV